MLFQTCQLLGQLPGVIVLNSGYADHNSQIEISVENAASMEVIQNCCMGANVPLEPWIKLPEQWLSTNFFQPVRCILVAETEPFELIQCGSLQILGIHLIWQLNKLGIMSKSSANILLEQLQGAPVGV
jgi:hypothetical protein